MTKSKLSLFLISLLMLSSCSGVVIDGSLLQANKALEKGMYDKALTKLTIAESYAANASPEEKRRIVFLKAKIYEQKGDTKAAAGLYKYIVTNFPESQEAYVAKVKLK